MRSENNRNEQVKEGKKLRWRRMGGNNRNVMVVVVERNNRNVVEERNNRNVMVVVVERNNRNVVVVGWWKEN